MQLISYVKTVTNKRLLIFESHDDSNQYTSCKRKPDTHDMYASRISPGTPHIRFLWAVHVRGNLSR
jgi:pectate lyase